MLSRLGIKFSGSNIVDGIARVIDNTGLLGRWYELNAEPYTICDTAHNEDGIREVVAQLESIDYKHLHIVLGMVNDKDVTAVLGLLPQDAKYYFCKASIPRALESKELASKARQQGLIGDVYETVMNAFEAARRAAEPSDMIYVGGSTFVVAEVL